MDYLEAIYKFLVTNWEIILAVVIGDLLVAAVIGIYDLLHRRQSRPKFRVELAKQDDKLGFQVRSENRSITDVAVLCDGIVCPWDEKGKEKPRADLFVGDEPATVLPYEAELRIVRESDPFIGIDFTIRNRITKTVIAEGHSMLNPSIGSGRIEDATEPLELTSRIRLVGKDIEEIRDYDLRVAITSGIEVNIVGKVADKYISYSLAEKTGKRKYLGKTKKASSLKYSSSTAVAVSGMDSRLQTLCSVLHASGVS
jgi:hypothetical protein